MATPGNDAWSGRHPQPVADGTDGPFATLARARDAVRELVARIRSRDAAPEGEIRVEVRGGRYYLPEPLALGPTDSGSAACPVTYAAYAGEKPILSGGVRLTGWQPFAGEILRCELPAGVHGELARFRQLVFDGARQRRARWPKFEPNNPIHGGWAFVEGPAEEDSHNAFVYRPGTFRRRWANPRQVEVNIYPYKGWCNCIVPVASIDEESRTIRLAHDVWDVRTRPPWYWSMPLSAGNRFFVENALEELDQPGEWCLDLERRHVYFWPPEPLTPDSEVVLPVLDRLIDVRNASHVTLCGLTLTETASGDNMHRTGLDGYGAQLPTPGWPYAGEAIHLRDTHHVTIEENRIHTVGGNAVYLEGYNSRNEILGNEVADCGANGITLIGTADRHPVDNRVADNDIHHCGVINKFVAGVFLGLSDGTTVQHNAIHDVPHHAINLGSNGYGRNVLEYNDIRRACREIFDTGAINSWADTLDVTRTYVARDVERSGHVIRHNFIGQTWGLAQDERGNRFRGNIVFSASEAPLLLVLGVRADDPNHRFRPEPVLRRRRPLGHPRRAGGRPHRRGAPDAGGVAAPRLRPALVDRRPALRRRAARRLLAAAGLARARAGHRRHRPGTDRPPLRHRMTTNGRADLTAAVSLGSINGDAPARCTDRLDPDRTALVIVDMQGRPDQWRQEPLQQHRGELPAAACGVPRPLDPGHPRGAGLLDRRLPRAVAREEALDGAGPQSRQKEPAPHHRPPGAAGAGAPSRRDRPAEDVGRGVRHHRPGGPAAQHGRPRPGGVRPDQLRMRRRHGHRGGRLGLRRDHGRRRQRRPR